MQSTQSQPCNISNHRSICAIPASYSCKNNCRQNNSSSLKGALTSREKRCAHTYKSPNSTALRPTSSMYSPAEVRTDSLMAFLAAPAGPTYNHKSRNSTVNDVVRVIRKPARHGIIIIIIVVAVVVIIIIVFERSAAAACCRRRPDRDKPMPRSASFVWPLPGRAGPAEADCPEADNPRLSIDIDDGSDVRIRQYGVYLRDINARDMCVSRPLFGARTI